VWAAGAPRAPGPWRAQHRARIPSAGACAPTGPSEYAKAQRLRFRAGAPSFRSPGCRWCDPRARLVELYPFRAPAAAGAGSCRWAVSMHH
jgi:hypothetical protein